MDITETLLDSKLVYAFPPYTLVKDTLRMPDDTLSTRTFVTHPGGVAVLAMNEQGLISFVRQIRHPIGRETLEIPAGKLDKDDRETKAEAAIRELREETGLSCDHIVELGSIHPSPAITDEVITLFFANGLHAGTQELDEDEFINTAWLSVDEVQAKVLSHEITDAKTICAFAICCFKGLLHNTAG
jgi:ADP-ribose pyrophosphatase